MSSKVIAEVISGSKGIFVSDVYVSGTIYSGDISASGAVTVAGDITAESTLYVSGSVIVPFPDNRAATPIDMTDNEVLYHCEETSGTTGTDTSGDSNDATLTNITVGTPGKVGLYAWEFASNGEAEPSASLNCSGDYTIAFWFFNLASNIGKKNIAIDNEWFLGESAIFVEVASGFPSIDSKLGVKSQSTAYVNPPFVMHTPDFTGWHHIVAVANHVANTTLFYVDGVPVGTAALKADTGIRRIGNDSALTNKFAEKIDEFAFWEGRQLSASEIANIYSLQVGGKNSLTVTGPSVFEGCASFSDSKILFLSGSGGATSPDESAGSDVSFYVSGSDGGKALGSGVSVFGGDVHVSGAFHIGNSSEGISVVVDDGLNSLVIDGDDYTIVRADKKVVLNVNNIEALVVGSGFYGTPRGLVVNEAGLDSTDFRVETNNKEYAIFSDAQTDQVLILSGGGGGTSPTGHGTDTAFYVSGSVGSRGTTVQGTSVFGGDLHLSGNLTVGGTSPGSGVDGAGAATRLAIWADSNTIMSNTGLHFNSFTLGLTGSASGPTTALDVNRIYSNVSSNTTLTSHAGASGILIDYDVTSAVSSGQFQKHKGLWIKYDQSGPNHVGMIQGEGLKIEVTGSDVGLSQTADGINVVVNHLGPFTTSAARGISVTAPAGWVEGEVNASHIRCLNTSTTDYFDISVGADGRSQITTLDSSAANAHLNIKPDGILMIHSGSEHDDASGNAQNYTDTNFFVSGSRGSIGHPGQGASVFGGDMVVSGTLTAIRSDDGVNSAIRIDKHYTGTTSVGSALSTGDDPAGLKINYDVVGAVDGTSIAAHDALSINYSQDVPTMVGTIQATGADIRMVGGNTGTQTLKGIAITLAGATTNTGIDITAPNDSTPFIARSSDHPHDFFKVNVGLNGATTLTTKDYHAALADLTLVADGKIIINAVTGDEVVFNEDGINTDFRVESSAEPEAIFLNASGDKLHFNKGKSAFSTTIWSNHNNALEVNSQGVTLNELGDSNNSFRVETATKTHALFVNAGTDQVLIHSGGAKTSPIGYGTDTSFFASGTMGDSHAGQNARSGRPNEGLSVFGGDLLSSGTVFTSRVRSTNESLILRGTDTGKEVSIGTQGIFLVGGGLISLSSNTGNIQASARDLVRLHTHGFGGTIEIGPNIVPAPTEQVLILSGGGPTSPNQSNVPDVNFFVSGSILSAGTSVRGTSLFGGDVIVSGSTYLPGVRFDAFKNSTVFHR